MTLRTSRLRNALRGSAGIAVAMGVMNVATYGYTIVAARLLGPQRYGPFAAVMGLLLVVGVLQLGLQATGARRIAAVPEDVAEVERTLLGVSYLSAVSLGVLCLLLTPVINSTLHLDSVATAALVALIAVPMTVMGGQAGILQGERRWAPLAVLYLAAGVPRLLVGTALLVWRPTEFLAILGVAAGFLAPVAVGWWALRRSARDAIHSPGAHDAPSILWETVRNSHALLAFFALSNADVIVARGVLDSHESGLYAGGLILVKAVLFLPQFVVVIAFPSMSTESARRTALIKSVVFILGLGLVAILAAWVLSGLTLTFIGGHQYVAIQHQLWRFALLGTLLSMLQLLVYSVVARQSRRSVYLVWAALILLVVGARLTHDVTALVNVVSSVDGALFLALLALTLWRLRAEKPAEVRV
ncbi:MAG: polysaccharide biosynthesis protein [Actinomycetota bacterium]|nr:polysaccharide biosynthesis protein [Actinomycetota bacterium]